MRALPDAPTTEMLREIASRHPHAVLAHPAFARLARRDAVVYAEIRAIAETETLNRAIGRALAALDEKDRRLVLCDCTESSLPAIRRVSVYAYDPAHSIRALLMARRYALGNATLRALRAADHAAWEDWTQVCDVAMDAPWNASLLAIRTPTVVLAAGALHILAWFAAQDAVCGAPKATWSRRWEEAFRFARRAQHRVLAQYHRRPSRIRPSSSSGIAARPGATSRSRVRRA